MKQMWQSLQNGESAKGHTRAQESFAVLFKLFCMSVILLK